MASELYEKYKDLAATQTSEEQYRLDVISAAGFFPWSMNPFELLQLARKIFNDPVIKSRVVKHTIFLDGKLDDIVEDPSTWDVLTAMTPGERQALRVRIFSNP